MARAVVHDLEVVDVHEHHRDGPGSSIRAVQGVRHTIQEERAVGQSGQRVMEGLMTELLLEGTAIGDITTIADNGTDVGVAEEIGEDRLELAPASVDMKEPRLKMALAPGPPRNTLMKWDRVSAASSGWVSGTNVLPSNSSARNPRTPPPHFGKG